MAKEASRKQNLDILRAICACMVVTIHCPSIFLPQYIESVTRMAVPMFFMISGYFYVNSQTRTMFRKVAKTLGLLVVTEIGYTVLYIVGGQTYRLSEVQNRTPADILSGNFVMWLPGWFLLILAYLYVTGWLLDTLKAGDSVIYAIIVVSLAFVIVSQHLGDPPGIWQFRTFFKGAPFFLGGRLIRKNEGRLKRIPLNVYGFLCVVSLMAVLVHKYVMLRKGMEGTLYMYAGTPFLTVSLFCFMLFSEPVNAPLLNYAGKNLSMYIYCSHIAVMSVLGRLNIRYESLWLCLVCFALTALFYESTDRIRNRLSASRGMRR